MWQLSKQHKLILFGIFIIGLVLRFYGLDFGLPNLARPDENHVSDAIIRTIFGSFAEGNGSLNPKFFFYPSLYIYTVGVVYALYYMLGHFAGVFPNFDAFLTLYQSDWTAFFYLSRFVSAIFGALTVISVYWLGHFWFSDAITKERKNSFKPAQVYTGLIAAFFMAVCYLPVRDAHFGVTDTMATFFTTTTLTITLAYYRSQKTSFLWWAAMLSGLSASVKYPCGLVLLPVILAFYFASREQNTSSSFSLKTWLSTPKDVVILLKIIGLSAFGFLVASPYVLLDYPLFLAHFIDQTRTMSGDPAGLPLGWWYHISFSLWFGLRPFLFVFSATGFLHAFITRQPKHIILASFILGYYITMGNAHYNYVRYVLPIIPPLLVYGAHMVSIIADMVLQRLKQPQSSKLAIASLTLITLAIGSTSLFYSITLDRLLATPDTRTLARNWLIENTTSLEAKIGIGLPLAHIDMPYTFHKYFLSPPRNPKFNAGNEQQNPVSPYHYSEKAVSSPVSPKRHEYNLSTYTDEATIKKLGLEFVILAQSPLFLYNAPAQEYEKLAASLQYKTVASFNASDNDIKHPANHYDQIDAFYLPFSDLSGVSRPGPDINIYDVHTDKLTVYDSGFVLNKR